MKIDESPLSSFAPPSENIRPPGFQIIFGILLLAFILVRNLWVSDDAFITLRTIDNFLSGYGLVWNAGERVQVFTHPLWLFILLPFCLFTPDRLYALYISSFLFSMGTLFLLLWNFASHARSLIIAVILLGGSMAFVDFSSSGLENPLTHMLVTLFFALYIYQNKYSSKWKLLQLSLIAAFSALNRLDTILLFIPALFSQMFPIKTGYWKIVMSVVMGFVPLLLWEVFATFYYGFPLPNTYYAKIGTGLDEISLFKQGWVYIQNSLRWDPLTLGTIALGILSVVVQRDIRRISIALGIILYLFYILWIGGDFMSGRFFSAIFIMGLILLLTFDTSFLGRPISDKLFLFLVIGLVLIGFSANQPPIFMTRTARPEPTENGIANEKLYYFYANGWVNYVRDPGLHYLAAQGIQANRSGDSPVEMNTIGMYGYHAGPHIYILDSYALADPLRARLPVEGPTRIGHYHRALPAGYWETIQSGFSRNMIEDPDLHLYYEKLSILIHGDLFAPGRMEEIIRFNAGYYDPLINEYWHGPPRKTE
jgi:arabinofuranosyltransferase